MGEFATTPGRASRIAAVAAAGLLCWPGGAWAGPLLSPQPLSAYPGDSFTLTLSDDFAAENGIGAFDLQLNFDQSLLVLTGVVNAAGLNQAPAWVPVFNQSTGLVSVAASCDFSIPACSEVPGGTGVALLDFTFDVLPGAAAGPTTITAQTQADAAGVEGEYQLAPVNATVTIQAREVPPPVPAPGASALLPALLALAGMLAFRRRRPA